MSVGLVTNRYCIVQLSALVVQERRSTPTYTAKHQVPENPSLLVQYHLSIRWVLAFPGISLFANLSATP